MGKEPSTVGIIVEKLNNKACLKQEIYKKTQDLFLNIRSIARTIVDDVLNDKNLEKASIPIEIIEIDEFEFQVKMGGDLIVFILQTNVVAFPKDHQIYKQKYIKKDKNRAYFGQIMIYNYVADSIKYNRISDTGYLIERLFLNNDHKFYVEGISNLNYVHLNVEKNNLNESILKSLITDAIVLSLDTDLVTTSFEKNFLLTLEQKSKNRAAQSSKKVGFQMNNYRD